MKSTILYMLLCGILLCACSADSNIKNEYSVVYEENYSSEYNYVSENNLKNQDYLEELRSFQTVIAELMYDHEYDTVKQLMQYNKKSIESALEFEFGSKDINIVIEYIDELSRTIKGTCEICEKTVYADDCAILPDGIICAHSECISANTNSIPVSIEE